MAEPALPAGQDLYGSDEHIEYRLSQDPAHRGELIVHDAVVKTIATLACLEVPGVVEYSTGLPGTFMGSTYPEVETAVAGDHVSCAIQVALRWPMSAAATAVAVRERVTARIIELTDMSVDSVDVTVAALRTDVATTAVRRVK